MFRTPDYAFPNRVISRATTLSAAVLPVIAAAVFANAPRAHAADADTRIVTITLVGDTGFAPNNASVRANGVRRHGKFQSWAETTSAIARQINGDLNFMNVETVVTDRNNLRRDRKGQNGPFNFRTHPNGIRHLVARGFNLASLANNHSMDYGVEGLRETLRHMKPLRAAGLRAAAGIGMNREEASRPQLVQVKGMSVAFSAIGIVTNNLGRHRAGKNKPGQIAYRFDADYELSLSRLAKTNAAYRILSIHYGIEGRVRTDSRQIKDYRGKAALRDGIDLIVGHHAHVPRGVEVAGNSVIFYGLGNFLHHGTANMNAKGICKDHGLMARLHLLRGGDGKLRARAIEMIMLGSTHARPKPMTGKRAAARVHALNYLDSRLGSKSGAAQGVRFTPQANGSGLYCFPGSASDPGSIGKLCANWRKAGPIPRNLRSKIARSCAR